MRLCLLIVASLAACSDSPGTTTGCQGNDECPAGAVCVSGECKNLCLEDSNCAVGEICLSDGLCVVGERTDTPVILTIDSNGSIELDPAYGAHHIGDSLIITGEHLEGSSVALTGASEALLQLTSTSATELVALLPTDVQSGSHTVRVFNQVGEDQGDVTLLRGEVGPPGPLNMFTTDTTITVPGDHASIHAALAFLDGWLIAGNATVTIQVTAGDTYDSPITIRHANGDRLRIIGDTTTPVALFFTGCTGIVLGRGAVLREMNGFRLVGDQTTSTHGLQASDGAVVTLGSTMEIESFGTYGIYSVRNAVIYAPGLTSRSHGITGVVAQQGGFINISDGLIEQNDSHGIYATENATVIASRATIQNNTLHGVIAYQGSAVHVIDATVQNNGRIGVYAWMNGTIRADRAQVLDNGTSGTYSGIQADINASIYAVSARSLRNGGVGVWAARGAEISFHSGGNPVVNPESSNNGSWGIHATQGAFISAQNSILSGNGNGGDTTSPAPGTVGNHNAYVYRP